MNPWRLYVRLIDRDLMKVIMQAKGIKSGSELARIAGVNVGLVNHLLRGGRTGRDSCSIQTATALERALGVDRGRVFEALVCPVAEHDARLGRVA